MKKILSLALALFVLAGALVSCSKEPTIDDLGAAFEKTSALTSSEIDMIMDMSFSMSGMSFDMSTDMNLKLSETDGKVVSYEVATSESMGVTTVVNTYTAEGISYIDDGDFKYKLEDSSSQVDIEDLALNSETVESFTYEKLEDGSVKYAVVLKEEATAEFISGVAADELTDLGEDSAISISDVSATVKDGYVVEMSLKLAVTASNEYYGEVSADMSVTLTVKNPGTTVEVPVPADLDEYVDYEDIDYSEYYEQIEEDYYEDYGYDTDYETEELGE